jgi:hypothetical protein
MTNNPKDRPNETVIREALQRYFAAEDPDHELFHHPDYAAIIGIQGRLVLIQADKIWPGQLHLNDPLWIANLKHNKRGYPGTQYQWSCDQCHMVTSADHATPSVHCAFCGHTSNNDNYPLWQKLKELMGK